MLPKVLMILSMPTMFCAGCAMFLVYRERKQWVWFAGLSVVSGVGAISVLHMIEPWRLIGH